MIHRLEQTMNRPDDYEYILTLCRPESDPVVRLPAGSNWIKMDVKLALRKTLPASYIPLCVCAFILENRKVIRQVPPSVGRMLDNCRAWTGRINGNKPVLCGCAAIQWLPKRHGHACVLSKVGLYWFV